MSHSTLTKQHQNTPLRKLPNNTPIQHHSRNHHNMAAMMPSGGGGSSRSANPYEHYDNPSIEGDDLIDPDDGNSHASFIPRTRSLTPNLSNPRRPRRPHQHHQHLRPRAPNRQHHLLASKLQLPHRPQRPRLPQLRHPGRRPPRAHQHARRVRVGDPAPRSARCLGEDAAGAVAEVLARRYAEPGRWHGRCGARRGG